MAFLPALAPALAGTGAAAAGTAAAGSALATGLSAGTILGTGAATSGILGSLGLNALGGMASTLPAAASLTAAAPTLGTAALGGATGAALSPTIFAKAAPALGGLQSLGSAAQLTPGLLQTAGMSPLGGMASVLPAGATTPSAASIQSIAASAPKVAPNYLTQGANAATDIPSVQNYLTQAPGESSRLGLKLTSEAPSGAEISRLKLTPETVQSALAPSGTPIKAGENFLSNLGNLIQNPSMQGLKDYVKEHPAASAGIGYKLYKTMSPDYNPPETSKGMIRPYKFERGPRQEAYAVSPTVDSSERRYFTDTFTALEPYEAPGPEYEKEAASGGIMGLAVGGPVEQMSAMNAIGGNTTYPQAQLQTSMYSNPMVQRPVQTNVISQGLDASVDPYSGEPKFAEGGEAKTEGGYKYAFDPKTQVFTQLSVPKLVPETRQSNYIGGGMGGGSGQQYTRYTGEGVPPGDDYQYIPGGMGGPAHYLIPTASQATPANTGSKISGGIAARVGGLPPLAPSTPTASAQPPMNVPAYQSPEERLGLTDFYKMMNKKLAQQGGYAAGGGVYDLGGYSDGGRLLKGPGDGVSDSIPAVIGQRQPARLADGEFVIPARIVSELGNGSTEAGARKLYAMMDRVQNARRKSIGKKKVAVNSRADKHLPA